MGSLSNYLVAGSPSKLFICGETTSVVGEGTKPELLGETSTNPMS